MNFGDSCAMKSKYLKKCGHLSQDRPQSSLFSRWQHVWKLWAGNLIKCTFPEAIISAMTVIQPVFTSIGLDKLHSSTNFHDSQNFWNKGYFGEFPEVEDMTWRCVTLHPDWWVALPLALVWQHTFSHPQASLAVFCLPRGGEPTFFGPSLSTHSAQGLLVRFQGTGYLATSTALQLLLHPWPGEQHQHISKPLMANTPFERAEIRTWSSVSASLRAPSLFRLWSYLTCSIHISNPKGSVIYWSRLDIFFCIDSVPLAFPILRRCTPNALRHFPATVIFVSWGSFMACALSPDLCIIDILLDHNLSRLKRSRESRLWTCDSVYIYHIYVYYIMLHISKMYIYIYMHDI